MKTEAHLHVACVRTKGSTSDNDFSERPLKTGSMSSMRNTAKQFKFMLITSDARFIRNSHLNFLFSKCLGQFFKSHLKKYNCDPLFNWPIFKRYFASSLFCILKTVSQDPINPIALFHFLIPPRFGFLSRSAHDVPTRLKISLGRFPAMLNVFGSQKCVLKKSKNVSILSK